MSTIEETKNESKGEAKWYIVHTYTGYEAMVKDTFEKMIENNSLQDQILDMKIPMEQTIEEKKDKNNNIQRKVVLRKVFPCYVFIKLIYSNDLWYLITNTRGVTGFVGPQGKAFALKDEEVARLRLEEVTVDSDYIVGDEIVITTGPFEGYLGTVISVDRQAAKVKAKVNMFNTETEVEVNFDSIKKK